MNKIIKTLAATASIAALAGASNAAMPEPADASYTVERVMFTSGGDTIVGDLYIPAGVTDANPSEAVIVTGSWTSSNAISISRFTFGAYSGLWTSMCSVSSTSFFTSGLS